MYRSKMLQVFLMAYAVSCTTADLFISFAEWFFKKKIKTGKLIGINFLNFPWTSTNSFIQQLLINSVAIQY